MENENENLRQSLKRSANQNFLLDNDEEYKNTKRRLKQQTFEASISKSSYERKLLSFETSQRELEIILKEKNGECSKYKRDLQLCLNRESDERRIKESIENDFLNYKASSSNTINELKKSLIDLKEDYSSLKSNNESNLSFYQQQIQNLKFNLNNVNERCKCLEEDLKSALETSKERQVLLDKTKNDLNNLEIDYQNQSNNQLDQSSHFNSFIRDELTQQSSLNRKLESNNRSLLKDLNNFKDRLNKFDIIKEENHSLKSKLKLSESLSQKLVIIENERDNLLSERNEWFGYLNDNNDSSITPTTLTKTISDLRFENISLKDQLGVCKSNKMEVDNVVNDYNSQINELNVIIKNQSVSINNLQSSLKSQNKLCQVNQQEVNILKHQLDSIIHEEEILNSNKFDNLQSDKIINYENLINELKLENERLRNEGNHVINIEDSNLIKQKEFEIESLKVKLLEHEQEIEKLKADATTVIENLEKEVVTLENKVGRGEYNVKTTRVLELKDNPVSQDFAIRTETLNSLKEENKLLLEQLKKSSLSTTSSNEEGLPKQTVLNITKEKEQLEKELSDKDKRMLRLKNIFSDKAVEFREAIYSLLGYRVQFLPNGRVRLNSAFMPGLLNSSTNGDEENVTPSVLFQSNADDKGTMKVEGGANGKLEGVEDLMQFWVTERESIPCFMANLVLELWDSVQRGELSRLAVR